MRVVVAIALLLLTVAADAADLKAGTFDPPRDAPAFTLESSGGGTVSLEQFRGRVVVLGFGFSNCTEVCPLTLHTLALARKQLGSAAADVQVLYVTVDPERDDAKRL